MVRKHWHGAVGAHVVAAAVTARVVVAAVVAGAAPHVQEDGQPLLSVAHVIAEPAAQPHAGKGPQGATVEKTREVARVVAAAVVAAAVVALIVVAFTVVVAARVVGALVAPLDAWQ